MIESFNSVLYILKSVVTGLVDNFYSAGGSVSQFAYMTVIIIIFPLVLSLIVSFIYNAKKSKTFNSLESKSVDNGNFRFFGSVFKGVHSFDIKQIDKFTGDFSIRCKNFSPNFQGSNISQMSVMNPNKVVIKKAVIKNSSKSDMEDA